MSTVRASKWQGFIPDDCEHHDAVSVVLDNQRRYVGEMNATKKAVLAAHIGRGWENILLRAAARVMAYDPSFDLFGTQPLQAASDEIGYLSSSVSAERSKGGAQLELRKQRVTPHVQWGPEARIAASAPLTGRYPDAFATQLVQGVLANALTHARRSILEHALQRAPQVFAEGGVQDRARLLLADIGRRCQRSEANRLVGAKRHWNECRTLEDRASYHFDPRLPSYQLLALRRGASVTDAAVIWAPVCFVVKVVDEEKRQRGSQEKTRQVIDVGLFHAHDIVDSGQLGVVNV